MAQKIQEKEIKFKHGELREIILDALGHSFVIGGLITAPHVILGLGAIKLIANTLKGTEIPTDKIVRVLHNLQKKDLISLEEKDDQIEVKIKSKGITQVTRYSIKALLDFKLKNKKWQGKWILVIFDVPEDQRNKRDQLRRFLDKMGFYRYQQSVYIFPYECEDEVALIKKILAAEKFIKYVIAEKIEDETHAKRFFSLL